MPSATVIAITQFLVHAALLGLLGPPEVGVGAYYAPGVMKAVCERRVQENWTPGLQCDWPCLVSAIEPQDIGQWWLVYHESLSYHLCLTVDVGQEAHLDELRARGEVVEVSWELAQEGGWQTYQEGVRVWRLDGGPPG